MDIILVLVLLVIAFCFVNGKNELKITITHKYAEQKQEAMIPIENPETEDTKNIVEAFQDILDIFDEEV